MASWEEVAAEAKERVDGAMNRQKPLGLAGRFALSHLAFAVACWLTRDFRSVVSPAVLAVADAREELAAGSAITPQAIGHNPTGSVVQPF
jgi:hypothetical protein